MSSDESDDDLLANLLGNANEDQDDSKSGKPTLPKQPAASALKEIDLNFLEGNNEDSQKSQTQSPKRGKDNISILNDHGNSSDEEDSKYFENQSYSEYGREIKNLLKNKESEKQSYDYSFKKENSFNSPASNLNKTPEINRSLSQLNSPKPSLKNDKYSLQAPTSSNNSVSKDVYKDPVFGLRMIKPLVSSAELKEKMQGRKAVTVSNVKLHLTAKSTGLSDEDWVIAGVIINKSATKTSQNGNQYCIWKISDLTTDMKTVSVFLFKSAYKTHWKLTTGAVIGILNPSVLDPNDYDLATLSVDNHQKIMILGTSRDLGKCKSTKKNGEPCTAPVNLSICEYCVYHIKQEYGKYSRRTELQATGPRNSLGNTPKGLPNGSYMQKRHPDAAPFLAIPAKRNDAQYKKDCERLALLRKDPHTIEKSPVQMKPEPATRIKITSVEMSASQSKKDHERLTKLREWSTKNNITIPTLEKEKVVPKFSLPPPKLGNGMKNGIIDFSKPVPKSLVNKARMNALEWVKKNGAIKKENPNKTRPSKEVLSEKGLKRRREDEEEDERLPKEEIVRKKVEAKRSKFQEMLEMKSSHSDLIEKREDEETEEYFKKLEVKERMEEKMLTTYKVNCKAVTCSICKYTAFSSSDLCKKLQHRVKVIDAIKRFFKCGDCGNRTVSLDRIPSETCKKCSSSKWVKAAMMDEKRTQIATSKLCIRGGEEKYIGSIATDASLNLLVPESD